MKNTQLLTLLCLLIGSATQQITGSQEDEQDTALLAKKRGHKGTPTGTKFGRGGNWGLGFDDFQMPQDSESLQLMARVLESRLQDPTYKETSSTTYESVLQDTLTQVTKEKNLNQSTYQTQQDKK